MEKLNSLYHLKPKNLRGGILLPLNELKYRHPDVYQAEIAKYAGREHLLKQDIPGINASWGDVVHLSAVHPDKIKKALIEAGHSGDINLYHYEIDPKGLDPEKSIVFLDDKIEVDNKSIVPFKPEEIKLYAELPEETKEHYRKMIASGQKPFLYHRVPHILYKGSIKLK